MTLVLALAGSDGVVLAGDRRSAIEEEDRRLVTDTSRKIFQVSDHVSVALCGRGDLGVYLVEKLAREARMREIDGIRSLFEFAPQFLIAAYDEATCRIQSRGKPPVGFVFAGLDRDTRGIYSQPRIYSMYEWEGFQPLISTTGWDASGIVWIAEYLISRFYAPSMTVDQLTKLASLAISETASQDSRVGGEPLLAVITASGYREMIGDHLSLSYTGTSERQSQSLATSAREERKQNGLLRDRPDLGWRAAGEALNWCLTEQEAMAGSTTINGVQFDWFVQSAFRIAGHAVIYVDPHLIRDGEKADLILITHDHFDHLDIGSIRAVADDATVIVANACCVRQLEGRVAGKVVPIEEGQTISEKGVDVRAVAAYNYMHPRAASVGFVFDLGGQTVYHAGDTDHIPEMASLGAIDVALLPIGGTYTMDEQEAAEAVKAIQPKVVIPIHYGYGTGGDPQRFASLVGAAARVVVLDEL